MAQWQKLLARMMADSTPREYTYDDAARVLRQLGFEVRPRASGSHRVWHRRGPAGNLLTVGLVDKGHGTLKPAYIRAMISTLTVNGLIPKELEANDE